MAGCSKVRYLVMVHDALYCHVIMEACAVQISHFLVI
jgi:hypothetical protein